MTEGGSGRLVRGSLSRFCQRHLEQCVDGSLWNRFLVGFIVDRQEIQGIGFREIGGDDPAAAALSFVLTFDGEPELVESSAERCADLGLEFEDTFEFCKISLQRRIALEELAISLCKRACDDDLSLRQAGLLRS